MTLRVISTATAIIILGLLVFYYAPKGGVDTNSTLEPIMRVK